MDLSLDEIIKMNNFKKRPVTQRRKPDSENYKANHNGGRMNGRIDKSHRQPPQRWKNVNPGVQPIDARMKIIQNNRQRITDARSKLAELAKQTDARSKIQKRKLGNQNGRQDYGGRNNFRPYQKVHPPTSNYKTPVVLQRSIKNNVAAHLIDPTSLTRTIHRTEFDFNQPYKEYMDIDEPFNIPSHNNYGGIHVALKNEFTPYTRQEYIPNRDSYMDLPIRRDMEFPRYLQQVPEQQQQRAPEQQRQRYMSMEMRARLDTTPRTQPPISPPQPQPLGYRIVVSNLHSSVTHEDIKELFEDIGPLITSRLVRAGTAEVIYKYQKDAKKAVEAYHNRQLDGQPMKCLLVNNTRSTSSSSSLMRTGSLSTATASKFPSSSQSMVVPDLSTVYKALFTCK